MRNKLDYMFIILLILSNLLSTILNNFQLHTERAEGYRIERITLTGQEVNFTWIRPPTPVKSWFEAVEFCQNFSNPGFLPSVNDVRYFYKTLKSDDAFLPRNVTLPGIAFYLQDVLESTMDYPNTESGERICLVVEKRPSSMVSVNLNVESIDI